MPKIGESAPQFTLLTDGGGRVSLSDFTGKKVVMFFYPKDDTPGCTKEACDFRDQFAAIKATGAVLLGISPDTAESHDAFKAKHQLPFTLLADADHAVIEAYGVWKEKTLYGRTFMGVERTTVLIDEQQKVAGVWQRVQVDGHAAHVLAVLKGEQPAPQPVDDGKPAAKVAARVELPKKTEAKKPEAKKVAPVKATTKAAKPAAAKAVKKPAAKATKPAAKTAAKPAAKTAKIAKPAAKKSAAKTAKPAAKTAKKPASKPAPKGKAKKR